MLRSKVDTPLPEQPISINIGEIDILRGQRTKLSDITHIGSLL
jgi:hypothetical protein